MIGSLNILKCLGYEMKSTWQGVPDSCKPAVFERGGTGDDLGLRRSVVTANKQRAAKPV